MLSRPGSSIIIKRLLMAALLAGVFFLSATTVTYLAVRGRTVEVPNVIGKLEMAAAAELDNAGLRMQISRAHNDKWSVDIVSDQSPAAGTIVKTGQIVRVSVSLGAPPSAQNAQK
ncbi:MAG: PASTA domain-containing protein [Acidobacteria bacterium]|nr:PASTA domain-containing protein [Acidobacteriota bacterium]